MSKVVRTILSMKKHSTELTIAFNNTSFNYYNFYSRCFVRALTRFIVVKDRSFSASFVCMCNRVKVAGPTRQGSYRGKSIDWIVSKKTKKDRLL